MFNGFPSLSANIPIFNTNAPAKNTKGNKNDNFTPLNVSIFNIYFELDKIAPTNIPPTIAIKADRDVVRELLR